MQYAFHADDSDDGRLFDAGRGCSVFSQRLIDLAGEHRDQVCDEVIYVLEGAGRLTIERRDHDVRAGMAVFVARGTPWWFEGDARAISVLVHEPEPSSGHAVIDLTEVEKGTATAGRQFILGATPQAGCASVTQFIGLVPPGRAPDHFHKYDEVIYILEGEGFLEIGGEQVPVRAGTCVHLPKALVHCIANTGDTELRLLGVFRPAGSPAEAYYPDGTLAVPSEGS
jgi:mannose-6-phosphate isomerase-like protein (cupin superfamily)